LILACGGLPTAFNIPAMPISDGNSGTGDLATMTNALGHVARFETCNADVPADARRFGFGRGDRHLPAHPSRRSGERAEAGIGTTFGASQGPLTE